MHVGSKLACYNSFDLVATGSSMADHLISSASGIPFRDRVTISQPFTASSQSYHHFTPSADSTLARHDEETAEMVDHIIMAIDRTSKGIVGCAYYVARHELLCCMQDIEHGEVDIIENLKIDVEPTIVILSSRVENDTTAYTSQRRSSLLSDDHDCLTSPWKTIVRPPSDFRFDNAMSKLVKVDALNNTSDARFLIPGENMEYELDRQIDEMGLVERRGRILLLSSSLELDSKHSIGCAGAIIGYLQRMRASVYLQHDPATETAYRVSRLEMFTMKKNMYLNPDSLSALQIIQSEMHPNVADQTPTSSGSKESLSLFGIFRTFARTPQGKSKLRKVFLRPSLDMSTILDRHEVIALFLQSENQPLGEILSKSLRRIKNMLSVVTLLRKGVERGSSNAGTIRSGAWAALLEFCYHCIDIGDTLGEVVRPSPLNLLTRARAVLNRDRLQQLGKMVHDVVDLEESLEQSRTVIKRRVNQNLDRVKEAYDGMEEVLARVATEITNTMPVHIDEQLNVVFLPQLGFHVTVPLDKMTNDAIWEGHPSWQRRFRTERHQYFKDDKMREMDTDWGDLHAVICDTEIEISHGLAQRVLQDEQWLTEASDFCGELDCLLALTHGARRYNLTRPRMVEDNVIDITGGRHILQEMTVASYVPNDTLLMGGNECLQSRQGPSMMLLTGPNYSGKSVYKKQVALIVYMAQIGSFVPAESATLGITDKIFTRINTAESVSKLQSAFAIDLQQIACGLRLCTNRSLMIIDEFGKGTDNCDGAGLASGVAQYLLKLENECPKVLASTHFHEMFERGDFDRYQNLAFAHMTIQVEHVDHLRILNPSSQVTYLYRLSEGRSTLSYGGHCAAMNGIPKRIIERAILLADLTVQGEDLVAVCSGLFGDELEELEEAEAIGRDFLNWGLTDGTADVRGLLKNVGTIGSSKATANGISA